MSYNEDCAKIWNQPRAENPTYRIARIGYRLDKFIVMLDHGGWSSSISNSFDTEAEAKQFIQERTK